MGGMRGRRLRAGTVCALVLAFGGATAAIAASRTDRPRARVGDYFPPADLERSRRYRGPAYVIAFGGLAVALAAGAALGVGPGLRGLGRWSSSVTAGRWALHALLIAAVVTVAVTIAELPFSIAGY